MILLVFLIELLNDMIEVMIFHYIVFLHYVYIDDILKIFLSFGSLNDVRWDNSWHNTIKLLITNLFCFLIFWNWSSNFLSMSIYRVKHSTRENEIGRDAKKIFPYTTYYTDRKKFSIWMKWNYVIIQCFTFNQFSCNGKYPVIILMRSCNDRLEILLYFICNKII